MMFNRFPKKTGIYHIKDNIEKLELQIYFRHINSLLKLPKFDYNKSICGEWRGREREYTANEGDEVKIVNIKWQEKLFSVSEEELYKDAKNCISETQRKYHKWLLERTAAEDNARELELEKGGSRRRRKKRTKKPTKSELNVNEPKHGTREIHTYVHDDNFPAKEKGKNASTNCESVVHMYIFAAIDIDTELVHLQWFPQQRLLHIYPDFNDISHNPYFIEIDKDYRHLYAYAVENVSPARRAADDFGLYLQLPEYAQLPHWRTEEERAALFNMPPKRTRRVSLLLELRDGGDFDYNGIHVRYHIDLPQHTIHEEGLLEASTHSSSCISESGTYIHHFGYNWQLTLLCEEEHYNASDFVHIYFEVISIDSWQRERVEGYAHLAICLVGASGALELHRLQCLRPVLSFWATLERFFIGGRRKFDFKEFFVGQAQKRKNADAETDSDEANVAGDFHSRYGCRMHSNGYLQFSYQRFTQRNCELLETNSNIARCGMTLDDIMCAYHEARKRLEAVILK